MAGREDQQTMEVEQINADTETDAKRTVKEQPEGLHMSLLRKALDSTIEKCISAGRFSLFAKNYPIIFKQKPKMLKSIHEQYRNQLKSSIKQEMKIMLEEENLVALMNELSQIINETPNDRPHAAWRPSGSAHSDVRAHLISVKLKQRDKLQQLVEELQEEEKQLATQVKRQRQRLCKTQEKVLQGSQALEQCCEARVADCDLNQLLTDIKMLHSSQAPSLFGDTHQ